MLLAANALYILLSLIQRHFYNFWFGQLMPLLSCPQARVALRSMIITHKWATPYNRFFPMQAIKFSYTVTNVYLCTTLMPKSGLWFTYTTETRKRTMRIMHLIPNKMSHTCSSVESMNIYTASIYYKLLVQDLNWILETEKTIAKMLWKTLAVFCENTETSEKELKYERSKIPFKTIAIKDLDKATYYQNIPSQFELYFYVDVIINFADGINSKFDKKRVFPRLNSTVTINCGAFLYKPSNL